jgi:hypothetical protein
MKINSSIAMLGAVVILAASTALPAFAQVNVGVSGSASAGGTSVSANASARAAALATLIANATQRADQEITRRIAALNALSTRVSAMVNLSSSDAANIQSQIQAQITLMNNLQTQIAADSAANSTSSLKTDIASITSSYRIFALIIPQGEIAAAAGRITTVANMLTTISGKLQVRITAAQAAGTDVTTWNAALADMNTNIAHAQAEGQAALNLTSGLQPDNGDKTVMQSNTAALQSARADIQTAQQDLTTARKDAGVIVKAILALDASVHASSTASSSAQ